MLLDRWEDFVAAGADVDAFLAQVDHPFRNTVTTANVRNRWLARSLHPRASRGHALARTLSDSFYRHERVADLPPRPQTIFTATDLTSGRAFRIARDFVGNWDYKYREPAPASIELGLAVAASAAFPTALTVISLPAPDLPQNPPAVLSLVDGGVYDNLGLEWFQGWGAGRPASAIKPDFLIVVNASGPRRAMRRQFGAGRALFRDLDIQYQQTLSLRVRWLIGNWLATPGRGAYVGITGDPRRYRFDDGTAIDPNLYRGALPNALVEPLSLLRTDLDRFSSEEADLLSYHAYWSLHARLGMYVPAWTVPEPAWNEARYAAMPDGEKQRLVGLLADGAKRRLHR